MFSNEVDRFIVVLDPFRAFAYEWKPMLEALDREVESRLAAWGARRASSSLSQGSLESVQLAGSVLDECLREARELAPDADHTGRKLILRKLEGAYRAFDRALTLAGCPSPVRKRCTFLSTARLHLKPEPVSAFQVRELTSNEAFAQALDLEDLLEPLTSGPKRLDLNVPGAWQIFFFTRRQGSWSGHTGSFRVVRPVHAPHPRSSAPLQSSEDLRRCQTDVRSAS